MITLKNSAIYFNNSAGIYRPGDILAGRIEINFNSTKLVRALYYEIIGKATVYWTESESTTNSDGNSSTTSLSYKNEEVYFKKRFYIVGKEKTDEKVEIPAGQHVYSFKYMLPSTLPPTFEGRDGKIKYRVKATLDRPWKIDKNIEASFLVESDIRDHPQAKEPIIMTIEKQFGVFFKSKSLKTILKAPHSGFVPGVTIPMTIEVMNQSNTTVNKISVKLKQITTFHATTKDSRAEKTIAKDPIPFQTKPRSFITFHHNLQVPVDVTLYDLSSCNIMDIKYEIRVELHTSGFTTNLVVNIPLYPIKAKS